MDGAMVGGLLAIGLAGVALVGSFALDPPQDEAVRGLRIVGRAFISGIACLGLVVVILAWMLESDVSGLLGLALGLLVGLAAVGDLAVLRSAQPGPRGRGRAVMLLAVAESVAVLAIVGLLLAIFWTAPY